MVAPEAEVPSLGTDVHAQRAGELFERGQYGPAAQEFARAFESTGQSVFLFAQAQALRRSGDCSGTIATLQRYIASSPAEADEAEAERIIAACQEVLSAQSDPAASDPPTEAPPPEASRRPPSSRVRPVLADPWGASAVGVGLGVGVVGGILIDSGVRLARPRPSPETAYEARAVRVRDLSTAGSVLVSVGAGLLIAGVVRYTLVARRRRSR